MRRPQNCLRSPSKVPSSCTTPSHKAHTEKGLSARLLTDKHTVAHRFASLQADPGKRNEVTLLWNTPIHLSVSTHRDSALVAQWKERRPPKAEVAGSTPAEGAFSIAPMPCGVGGNTTDSGSVIPGSKPGRAANKTEYSRVRLEDSRTSMRCLSRVASSIGRATGF